MCRWMEGMALKKEQPGMSNVCMIIGLRFVLGVARWAGLDVLEGGGGVGEGRSTYTVK